MRKLIAAFLIAAAASLPLLAPSSAASAATISELGDLSALSAIASDTLAIARSGDLAAAERRITDFETAWDQAAGTMQPLSPAKWQVVDMAADGAIEALRAPSPNPAEVETALGGLIAALDNPTAPAGGDINGQVMDALAVTGLVTTNPDGSPLPCEVALKTLRDAAAGRTPSDQAQYDTLMNKGLERCNADDDKRADGFFAQAYDLLN